MVTFAVVSKVQIQYQRVAGILRKSAQKGNFQRREMLMINTSGVYGIIVNF